MADVLAGLPPGSLTKDVISYSVKINGSPLAGDVSLSQITVNKTFNKIASAKLVFLDGSVADRDFELSNDETFKPGNEIEVSLGYDGAVETVFKGIIIKHGIKVRQQGPSVLLIEAKDKAVGLTISRKRVYFNNKTDSIVMSTLAGSLLKDIDPTTLVHKQLVQFDATDWDFFVTRAEANGMLVLTDDGKIIAKKPSTLQLPVFIAVYGENIWEFEAEMDVRRQYAGVTSQAWDYQNQALVTSNAGTGIFVETGNISSSQTGAVLNAELLLSHSGNIPKTQLQAWSDAHILRSKLSKAIGRVRVKGNAAVKPGTMITLLGVGDRFNGNVFVTGVLHHYEGLWQTDIQFGWREDWFYKKDDVMEKPASGLVPGINGLQIGIVDDLNDQELGGQFRVKVHIPTISGTNDGIWARVAALDAGKKHGVYFRPQKSDEVVLGFLNDDPRDPIILGCLHSKSGKESPLPATAGELHYGIVTKEGLKLIFDDTNKNITLRVPVGSSDEKTIIFNNSGAMEMKDEHGNSIKMNSSGITIKSTKGITIDAGSANTTIKGSKVMIN